MKRSSMVRARQPPCVVRLSAIEVHCAEWGDAPNWGSEALDDAIFLIGCLRDWPRLFAWPEPAMASGVTRLVIYGGYVGSGDLS